MIRSGLSRWVPLIAGFYAGQIGILSINLATGFLILRALTINEYAIYILASLLQAIGALGTDLGMSQGVVSIGAPLRDDKRAFGTLVRGAILLRQRLFLVMVPVVSVLAYVLLHAAGDWLLTALVVTGIALAIVWFQQSGTIATAILNTHHDSEALIRAGVWSAVARLVMVVGVCTFSPYAITALLINLIGAALHARLLWRKAETYLSGVEEAATEDHGRDLLAFIRPLLPGIIYFALQGHVSTFLLALSGATTSIAEVGALGRLWQVVGVLVLINGFFVQPYFARIADREQFIKRTMQVAIVLLAVFTLVTLSSLFAPSLWLALLGPSYAGLSDELVLALLGAQLSVAGTTFYTIIIATRRTKGQWLQIPLGLIAQVGFVATHKMENSWDALLLNVMPVAASLLVELGLFMYVVLSWRASPAPARSTSN